MVFHNSVSKLLGRLVPGHKYWHIIRLEVYLIHLLLSGGLFFPWLASSSLCECFIHLLRLKEQTRVHRRRKLARCGLVHLFSECNFWSWPSEMVELNSQVIKLFEQNWTMTTVWKWVTLFRSGSYLPNRLHTSTSTSSPETLSTIIFCLPQYVQYFKLFKILTRLSIGLKRIL